MPGPIKNTVSPYTISWPLPPDDVCVCPETIDPAAITATSNTANGRYFEGRLVKAFMIKGKYLNWLSMSSKRKPPPV
jgi:hypothetical protein